MSPPLPRQATFERSPLREQDVVFRKNRLARRYIARIDKDARVVITLPFRGSKREALAFANQHLAWIYEQQAQAAAAPLTKAGLRDGDEIWFRGRKRALRVETHWGRPVLRFADQSVYIADAGMDLSRPLAEHLRKLAKEELPELVLAAAREHRVRVAKVAIRDQKTRWGSCSSNRAISLNWRLVMAPEATRDYIVLHELMHLRQMNHSPAFWRLVEAACPDFRKHERWLSEHQESLNW